MKTVSIVTATYNSDETIVDCLNSIAQQSVGVEHIVIDGASCDETLSRIENHAAKPSLVISEPDQGIYDAMNKGIKKTSGDIVGLLNSDDMYCDCKVIERIIDRFEIDEVDACYGDLVYVDKLNIDKVTRYWKSGDYNVRKFYWGWMPPHPTFFVRRELYEKYGLFRMDMGSAADYELMLRFLVSGKSKVAYIPELLVKMRAGGISNGSIRARIEANKMDRKSWQVNNLSPYPWTLYMKPMRKLSQWVQPPPK